MFLTLFVAGFTSILGSAQCHTLNRRSLDSFLTQHDHPETNDVIRGHKASGHLMEEDSIGYRLTQHNNPDLPGENRHMQALDSPFFTGICNPDMVCLNERYRSIDGSCNNFQNPGWGQAGTPFRRILQPKQSVIRCGLDQDSRLPNPRITSWTLNDRVENDIGTDRSMITMVFGQTIDHDITLTPLRRTSDGGFLDCCFPENHRAPECCPILIINNDPFYSAPGRTKCIPFLRSSLTVPPGSRCKQRQDVENSNTAFIDASFVYGSDVGRALSLRTMTGGLLKVTLDNKGRVFPFISTDKGFRMNFGDNRGDVHPAFTLILTTFLRNHNRMAITLAALHPDWSDEILYQEARKINIALLQHFTYTQFIDALLGVPNDISVPASDPNPRDFYNPKIDPSITLPFSTAAYRLHTYVGGSFLLVNKDFKVTGELLLRDVFHKPLLLLKDSNYDELIRGLTVQPVREYNNKFTPEMTEWLFKEDGQDFGHDIIALNVQRGRDHQIQGYSAYKQLCGFGAARSWQDLSDLIPEESVRRLSNIYQKPEDVDMYIGQNMERIVTGSMLGPTAHCLVRDQFASLRDGDRFFYTRPNQFTPGQLAAIKRTTLSRLFCDGADDPSNLKLPANMFRVVSQANPAISCLDSLRMPFLDLSPWK